MKHLQRKILLMLVLALSLVGCAGNYKSKLVGSWYSKGSSNAAFTFYSDGTCEIDGEYGTGTWSVVNENQLKMTNIYGESETATIVSIKDGCLTLGNESSQVQFWNSPQAEK